MKERLILLALLFAGLIGAAAIADNVVTQPATTTAPAAKTPSKLEVSTLDAGGAVIDTTPLVPLSKTFDVVRTGVIFSDGTAQYTYTRATDFPALVALPPPAIATQPTTPPDTQPATPTTAPVQPAPTPITEPTPDTDRTIIKAGSDLGALAKGKFRLLAGTYKLPASIKEGVDIEGDVTDPSKVILLGQSNVTCSGGTDVRIAGVTIEGGGTKGTDISQAALDLNDGWTLDTIILEKAAGYGASVTKCDGFSIRNSIFRLCGSGGLGGTSARSGTIANCTITANNQNKGADSNKWTRTEGPIVFDHCAWTNNFGKGCWLDYGNSNVLFNNCTFTGNQDFYRGSKLGDAGDGLFLEISGALPVSIGSQSLKLQGPITVRNCTGSNNRIGISAVEASKSKRNDLNSRSSCHVHIEGGTFGVIAISGGEGKRTEPSDRIGDSYIHGCKYGLLFYDTDFGDVRKSRLWDVQPSVN